MNASSATRALAFLSSVLFGCVAMSAAAAQGQAPPRVAEVQREIRQMCEGGARFRPGFHRTADFNGDGRRDHIIDYGAGECIRGGNPFCGSAGCVIEILVSGASGYSTGFNSNVQRWRVQRQGNRDLLVLDLHGSACGRSGADGCARRLAWNGRSFAPVSGRR